MTSIKLNLNGEYRRVRVDGDKTTGDVMKNSTVSTSFASVPSPRLSLKELTNKAVLVFPELNGKSLTFDFLDVILYNLNLICAI